MSTLCIETLTLPAADLGPENPLPPLKSGRDLHVQREPTPGIPDDMLRNIAYGRVPNILPYTMQDGYTRQREPHSFRVAVLENDILRATFMLERGGRLWSLFHKPSGRELLEVNPVFQPANLALRNAWFSGGVEWNIGTTGHSLFTCAPLFAARVTAPDGTPVLRFYEWERIRQVPFQIDAYLPDGSPVLFVRVRITNPHDRTVPMYWWSNIAVPETEHTRVLVPADTAYSFGYGGRGLRLVDIPTLDDGADKNHPVNISYTTNVKRAADFFFHIPDGQRPWIAALDKHGRGLIQTSTSLLKGRKLFLWGQGTGGRRWQTFLSQLGHAYLEIQAGLARTQLEHLPMPPHAEWMWLEAYGLLNADPDSIHGDDWQHARATVNTQLERLIPQHALETAFAHSMAFVDKVPDELLQRGSGWGALERLRRKAAGQLPFCSDALIFDEDTLSAAQTPWLALLREGTFPEADPNSAPPSYMIQSEWQSLLEQAPPNWQTYLHLGVMHHYAGQRNAAREAWQHSLETKLSPWALRNLALLAWEDEGYDNAADLYSLALQMQPRLLPLAIECGQKLIAMSKPQLWLDLLATLPKAMRKNSRIRLLEGQAALEMGDLDRVAQLFESRLIIDDMREGERSLSYLWFAYHEKRISIEAAIPINNDLKARVRREHPVPAEIDYRMS